MYKSHFFDTNYNFAFTNRINILAFAPFLYKLEKFFKTHHVMKSNFSKVF